MPLCNDYLLLKEACNFQLFYIQVEIRKVLQRAKPLSCGRIVEALLYAKSLYFVNCF